MTMNDCEIAYLLRKIITNSGWNLRQNDNSQDVLVAELSEPEPIDDQEMDEAGRNGEASAEPIKETTDGVPTN